MSVNAYAEEALSCKSLQNVCSRHAEVNLSSDGISLLLHLRRINEHCQACLHPAAVSSEGQRA